jgi:tetratricopeptide (TPR) repeat protein
MKRRRRPLWQPTLSTRLLGFLKDAGKKVTFGRTLIAIVLLPVIFYVYSEVTRNVLIIDPFTVPKRFEEMGLTSEVMANRIGDALRQTERNAKTTQMKNDQLAFARDEGSPLEVEIPGTKLGLKTVIDVTRTVLGRYPKHISGDIVIASTPEKTPQKSQAKVTFYITQGRDRRKAGEFDVTADDIVLLVRSTAEVVLKEINPYLFAVTLYDCRHYEQASIVFDQITQDLSQKSSYRVVTFNFWGAMLSGERKYEDAIAKYRKAIGVDPKYAVAYVNWGNALDDEGKHDDAVAKYQKAIELDPKFASAYVSWGNALNDEGKHADSIAKYQKAIEVDPQFALAYISLGNALIAEGNPEDAIAKYQKAIEVDPQSALAYIGLGSALIAEGNPEDAIAKFRKALDVDPKAEYAAYVYNVWGLSLKALGKNEEAQKLLDKAKELSSHK